MLIDYYWNVPWRHCVIQSPQSGNLPLGETRGAEESEELYEKSRNCGESVWKKQGDKQRQTTIHSLCDARGKASLEHSQNSRKKSHHSSVSVLIVMLNSYRVAPV